MILLFMTIVLAIILILLYHALSTTDKLLLRKWNLIIMNVLPAIIWTIIHIDARWQTYSLHVVVVKHIVNKSLDA